MASIFWPLLALYLGYGWAETFLKGIVSPAWKAPEVLLFAAVFFGMVRWLRAENDSRLGRSTVVREPLAAHWPLLQSRSLGQLRELLGPTRNANLENAIAHAANERNCRAKKACCAQKKQVNYKNGN